MKPIVEHYKPYFAIFADRNQWTSAEKTFTDKKGEKTWGECSYFPNLALLMDDLAESLFRRLSKPGSGWQGIQEAVNKTYKLLDSIQQELKSSSRLLP